MTYRIWKLRTGRRAGIPQTIDISVILLAGAVGSFVALFLLLTYFWSTCAYYFYADFPDPVKFTVADELVTISDGSRKNRDYYVWMQPGASKERITDPGWIDSWNEGISLAAQRGKPTLVVLRSSDSYWSDRMDKDTLSSPEIRKCLNDGWVCIRIDLVRADKIGNFGGKAISYRGMARAFHVEGVPTALFIDRYGQPVQVVPGFIPKETFSSLLDYMKNRVYEQNIPFEKYRINLVAGKR